MPLIVKRLAPLDVSMARIFITVVLLGSLTRYSHESTVKLLHFKYDIIPSAEFDADIITDPITV